MSMPQPLLAEPLRRRLVGYPAGPLRAASDAILTAALGFEMSALISFEAAGLWEWEFGVQDRLAEGLLIIAHSEGRLHSVECTCHSRCENAPGGRVCTEFLVLYHRNTGRIWKDTVPS